MYLVGLTVFSLASLLCGVATDVLMLQLSRGLQGVGGAIMFSVSLALLADAFRGKDRGVAFGIWGAITGLAVAIGPLLGGALTSGLSWRWIFFVNLPIGVIAVVITVLKVAESRSPQGAPPRLAGLRAVHARPVQPGLRADRVQPEVVRQPGGHRLPGRRGRAAGRVRGRRTAQRRTRCSTCRCSGKPTFTGGAVAAFGLSASIFSLLLYLVLYLQDILGYSALGTGLRLLVLSGGILATSTVAGRLTSHVPVRFLIGPGLLLVGVGLLLMRGLDASTHWTHLIPGLILAGAGVGLVNPPLASTAVGVVEPAAGGHGVGHQLDVPPGRHRHRHRAAGHAVLELGQVLRHRPHRLGARPERTGRRRSPPRCSPGTIKQTLVALPANARDPVGLITKSAFTTGLNGILLVAAIIALASAVIAFASIRTKDFAHQGG